MSKPTSEWLELGKTREIVKVLVEALTLLFEDWQTLTNQDYNEGNEDVRQLDKQARAALAQAKGVVG